MPYAWHTRRVKFRRSCFSLRRFASHGTTRQRVVDACGGVARILLATLEGLAADSAGNLYAIQAPVGYSWKLFEYPSAGSPKVLFSNSASALVIGIATGSDGTLYAGTDYRSVGSDPDQFEVQTLAPGASTWHLLLGGAATGLPQDQISASIVVP